VPAAEIRSGGADRPLSTRCNYPAGVHAGFVLLTDVDAQLEQFTVNARRSPSRVSRCSSGRIRSRTSNGTRNLVLAAEFIPQGRVADQHDVVVAAAP